MTYRYLRMGVLAVLTASMAGGVFAQTDRGQVLRQNASLLRVETENEDNSVSLGTGVVVARGIVATNCHVTRDARAISLVRGARRIAVEKQYADVEHDLCLLHAKDAEALPAVTMDRAALSLDQPVTVVGFATGQGLRLGSGVVRALHDYDGAQVVETSAPFGAGDSGGGLFDSQGRLVGIVSFYSRATPVRGYALPIGWLTDALARDQATAVQPLAGLPFWERQPEGQPYFLRTASLEDDRNWSTMAYVAQRWSAAEARNPLPWLALGKARYHLSESRSAIDALSRAAQLAPTLAAVWCQLSLAYAATAENNAAGQALAAFRRLAPIGDCRPE